ncbi:oxygen-dependent protoporphyrinogen oxidase [Orbilia brochopaga]|uniref:Protoporphyrinogen oxidase n=1 Tax=Orbilia brochopaga TaxID=3140254 RepID=A0AAV9UE64_9PEZI
MKPPMRPRRPTLPKCSRRSIPWRTLFEHEHGRTEPDFTPERDPPKSVAILGGGITGLTAAYNLRRYSPETKITLLEASPRTGGWVRTYTIPTAKGTIRFESGPRTLRPGTVNGLITLSHVKQLKLQDELLLIPRTSPAAQNRYIYYPDQINPLPSSITGIFSALRLPILKGAVKGILLEPFRRQRPKDVEDESIESFLTRRVGPVATNNLFSAVFHGIYAGDISKLSADALMHESYRNERLYGSMTMGAIGVQESIIDDELLKYLYTRHAGDLLQKIKGTSMYSFKGGMETLTRTLDEEVRKQGQTDLKTGVEVIGLRYIAEDDTMKVLGYDGDDNEFTFVISTLPAWKTAALLPPGTADALSQTDGVNVMVVNLFYDTPNLLPYRGFGYLIPKSTPLSNNPHRALGVIFDSDAMPGQDERPGTKVTVMLGGHWWDSPSTPLPSESDGVAMAREVLHQHLGVTDTPAETMSSLHRRCIPQYTVNHAGRLRQTHQDLMDKMGGRLVLAGSSYGGVGLNDCVRSGRDAAFEVATGQRMSGLERWAYEQEWIARDSL